MSRLAVIALILVPLTSPSLLAGEPSYVVVVSRSTRANDDWRAVVDALVAKHRGSVVTFDGKVGEAREELVRRHPRLTCFVARPDEATREFVAQVHELTRAYDADPYTDTLWGILTGFDAGNALRIARHTEPLTVRKVASGTEFATEMVEEGVWYCELQKNRMVEKKRGSPAVEKKGPDDTTKALADTLTSYQADLFITSGHATERNWQIGFRYRNGYFKSSKGELFGEDTRKQRFPIVSPNPKVYLPIGNCLMANIDGPDAMALAWMNKVGVHQMVGYTVPTWFGYGGWGCLDYFVEQPGRYTFVEAFFANQHGLIHSIENKLGNQRGMRFDKNVVVLYGDPGWVARMADRPKAYEQKLVEKDGIFSFVIRGNRGARSFEPINTNGAQRGWRPIVEILPYRVTDIEVLDDGGLSPIVADDFILVPNPRRYDPSRRYELKFRARRVDSLTATTSR